MFISSLGPDCPRASPTLAGPALAALANTTFFSGQGSAGRLVCAGVRGDRTGSWPVLRHTVSTLHWYLTNVFLWNHWCVDNMTGDITNSGGNGPDLVVILSPDLGRDQEAWTDILQHEWSDRSRDYRNESFFRFYFSDLAPIIAMLLAVSRHDITSFLQIFNSQLSSNSLYFTLSMVESFLQGVNQNRV